MDEPIPHRRPGPPLPSAQVTAISTSTGPHPQPKIPPPTGVKLGAMLGKYRIYALLGHGGMGDVYAAEDTVIHRKVAIKILPPQLSSDPSLMERLLAEAQAAAKLNHPNVVTIFDVLNIDNSNCVVMELIPGGSLQDYLGRKGSPGWRSATRLIGEACKALVAAHDSGLIHRDIKPSNLMLTADGHIKVADFGLAKVETGESAMKTQAGAILGTPAFMSPEQCRGDKIDARTDIYSLGCTYYALLTGKPPFEAASSIQTMFAHCSSPIPDPRELSADIPQGCVDVLNKALAKDPRDRSPSAKEMLNDLRSVLGGGTISLAAGSSPIADNLAAEPPPPPPPAYIPPGGHSSRLQWLAIAGMGVVVLILAGVMVWWLGRNNHSAPDAKPAGIVQASAAPPQPAFSNFSQTQWTVQSNGPLLVQSGSQTAPTTMPTEAIPMPVVVAAPAVTPLPAPIIANSIDQKLRLIPAGSFIMGDASLPDAPPHKVTISKPFYMCECECTQGEYEKVMGASKIDFQRAELPAATVTWKGAMAFCTELSNRPEEKAAGRVYRLPTEAEWEYACRAGTTTKFSFGDTLTPDEANFGRKIDLDKLQRPGERPHEGGGKEQAKDQPPRDQQPKDQPAPGSTPPDERGSHPLDPAGIFPANPWGLHDMHGSVWQWCSDFYSPDYYKISPEVDPQGPDTGTVHVARGGCWSSTADQCASAYRNSNPQVHARIPGFGFRVVCDIPQN